MKKNIHFAHNIYLCVSYYSHNKEQLFPQTPLKCSFLVLETGLCSLWKWGLKFYIGYYLDKLHGVGAFRAETVWHET